MVHPFNPILGRLYTGRPGQGVYTERPCLKNKTNKKQRNSFIDLKILIKNLEVGGKITAN